MRRTTKRSAAQTAELEKEIAFLREHSVQLALENAQLKGENEELRHANRLLQQQQRQKRPASPPSLVKAASTMLSPSRRSAASRASMGISDIFFRAGGENSMAEIPRLSSVSSMDLSEEQAPASPMTEHRRGGRPINAAECSSALSHLSEHKTFACFSMEQLKATAAAMTAHDYGEGEVVIREGDTDDERFFIVSSGQWEATVHARGGEPVATYTTGGSFGELALRYGSARKATVTCRINGTLWALDRSTFQTQRPDSGSG